MMILERGDENGRRTIDLPRMPLKLPGNLLNRFDRLDRLDRLEGDPGFELGFVSSSFGFPQANFGLRLIPKTAVFIAEPLAGFWGPPLFGQRHKSASERSGVGGICWLGLSMSSS